MKKLTILFSVLCMLSACVNLTYQETKAVRSLKTQGITIDKPVGEWEKPANSVTAGALNILPGFGNFYLAIGNGGDDNQFLYGFLNLLTWPISIIWGVPEAVIDSQNINNRELIYFYTFDEEGINALEKGGFRITSSGKLEKIK